MNRTYSTNPPVTRLTPRQCGAILARNGYVFLLPDLTVAEHCRRMEEGLLKISVQSWSRDRVDYWVSLNGPHSSCTCPDWLRNRVVVKRGAPRPVYWCQHMHAVALALADRAAEEWRRAPGTTESPSSLPPRETDQEAPPPLTAGGRGAPGPSSPARCAGRGLS